MGAAASSCEGEVAAATETGAMSTVMWLSPFLESLLDGVYQMVTAPREHQVRITTDW
jgi:hypothetical protein